MTPNPKPPPQPPISQPATRLRLLAWTYHDACTASHDTTTGNSTHETRIPSRNPELWDTGSYKQLERALDETRQTNNRQYRHFVVNYIGQPLDKHPAEPLDHMLQRMPTDIHVPQIISEAAGYTPHEGRRWERRSHT
jgi:hypothetical protein